MEPVHGTLHSGRRRLLQSGAQARAASRRLLILAALAALPVTLASARPLVADDLYRLQEIADPQFSPDGQWIAYTVTSPDRAADADRTHVWLASWDGRETRQATRSAAGEHAPRWSPDGRMLAFLSDRTDEKAGDQIWLLDRAGGEAQQRSHFASAITGYAWSPDGKRIVFTAQVPAAPDEDPEKPAPIVIDRLQFKSDDAGYLRGERSHLFLMDVASGTVTPLTEGAYDELHPAWSPDGTQIAFISKRGADPDATNNWDLYLIAPQPGAAARQLTTNPGADGDADDAWLSGSPRFSADGKRIAYLAGGAPADLWYGLAQVGVIDTAGGRPAVLPTAALDRNTLEPRWSPDGKWLYFRLEDDMSMVLARVRLADGHIERLTPSGGVVSEFALGPQGRVAVVHGTSLQPGELAVLERGGLRRLSHHNDAWLAGVDLAAARPISAASTGGIAVHALLFEPQGRAAGERVPTLLRLHGGPVSQHQQDFDFQLQLFAASGYAVVAPNPRGSTGRGYAYQRALFANWGAADVPDVLAITDRVVADGIADPARLGVGGWSYGSILTNYVIAMDTRFKAATSGAGMANMLGGYGTDQYTRDWETELGLPWEHPDLWLKLSYAFLHADRIRTPTLFLCGADDFNVPLPATEQMYQAVRRVGVPTQLVIYPGQHHQLARPGLRVDRLQRYLDWYRRYLGVNSAAAP
jgi:dipeptidyl aminopeptidase/acylaminoacyl peptidase